VRRDVGKHGSDEGRIPTFDDKQIPAANPS
jgi:hypothetical protein